jgi:MoxR-like ATPase
VQSALLEAMEERQVTVGGKRHKLPDLFMVLATQNPIEQEGTYPLPEAQMDRFLMHIKVDYPASAEEILIMRLVRGEAAHGVAPEHFVAWIASRRWAEVGWRAVDPHDLQDSHLAVQEPR